MLIWDLPLLFRLQPLAGKDASPEALWNLLGAGNAIQAHRALWQLTALPSADAFLARRLAPVKGMPPERLRALLADLGSADFATREKAERALAEAGEAVHAALAEAAAGTKDAEVRRRLARLRERLQPRSPERLREVRATLVLEARATAEARRLLRELASGLPEARLTQEAKASLERLSRRPAPAPRDQLLSPRNWFGDGSQPTSVPLLAGPAAPPAALDGAGFMIRPSFRVGRRTKFGGTSQNCSLPCRLTPPLGRDEFERVTEMVRAETIDIHDRSRLIAMREQSEVEVAGLREPNRIFTELCNVFYQSRTIGEPFENLNESYWT